MGYSRDMDSEKNTHMRELLEAGRPVTDEGPYYHHSWWEAYKGSVKGKLGGGFLGGSIGVVVGTIAVAALSATGLAIPLTVAGFAAAGMLYGLHEFSDVGKVTGAVAAAHKVGEQRMRAFEEGKFNEIKEEIGELKALVKGEKIPVKTASAVSHATEEQLDHYRTDHFQGSKVQGVEKVLFWKIALVGLVVGVAAGAMLGFAGVTGHLLEALGAGHMAAPEAMVASMAALGAVGASFGINRDIFRQAFDQTDMWFRGFVSHGHSRKALLGKEPAHTIEKTEEKPTLIFEAPVAYPESGTHHRDRVIASAQRALAEMDHTQMRPH